jgi:hypothetical protein
MNKFSLMGLTKFKNDAIRIEDLMKDWMTAYPHIDVPSQIHWAHNWLLENPKKDKKNYVRFLGNWMRSAERMAVERGTNIVRHKPYKEQRPAEDEIVDAETIARAKVRK